MPRLRDLLWSVFQNWVWSCITLGAAGIFAVLAGWYRALLKTHEDAGRHLKAVEGAIASLPALVVIVVAFVLAFVVSVLVILTVRWLFTRAPFRAHANEVTRHEESLGMTGIRFGKGTQGNVTEGNVSGLGLDTGIDDAGQGNVHLRNRFGDANAQPAPQFDKWSLLIDLENFIKFREMGNPAKGQNVTELSLPPMYSVPAQKARRHNVETVRQYNERFQERAVSYLKEATSRGTAGRHDEWDRLVLNGPQNAADITTILNYLDYLSKGLP